MFVILISVLVVGAVALVAWLELDRRADLFDVSADPVQGLCSLAGQHEVVPPLCRQPARRD